jgi:hypothetical protein
VGIDGRSAPIWGLTQPKMTPTVEIAMGGDST